MLSLYSNSTSLLCLANDSADIPWRVQAENAHFAKIHITAPSLRSLESWDAAVGARGKA
jgi:hypothetical protein